VVACSSYGRCHCGCGGKPKRSQVTHAKGSRYKDQPYVFVAGHQARVLHARAGAWSAQGVPVERVRPLLLWLRARHGSLEEVALLVRIPRATLHGYCYNRKRKRVPPDAARAIAELVLAHRRTSGVSIDTWAVPPGLRTRDPVPSGRSQAVGPRP